MVEKKVTIINKLGLHARAAALIVQTASKFAAEINLVKDGAEINGKSILGVMMLAAEMGSEVLIRADGDDEEEALSALIDLVEAKFHEEE